MQQGQDGAIDELVSPASFCYPASPTSFFSAPGHHPVLDDEFVSCGLPEQWLMGDKSLDDTTIHDAAERVSAGGSAGSDLSAVNPHAAAAMCERSPRKRGRKPLPRSNKATISHVAAERQRRENLNRRFCNLRAAVPMVSRMDKASLLADAAAYIAELRGRVEQLEDAARQQAAAWKQGGANPAACLASWGLEEKLEVRMVGREAATVRLTTAAARHAPARLMGALRSLDLPVQHACVSCVGGAATVQDAVVDVPAALQDEGCLGAALVQVLQQQDSSA